nr:hemagglutinin repeat-containing protein [Pseudomonas sp. GM102]
MLATNNLTNRAGGIIAGRDVTLTATRGDVINERTVTTHESGTGYTNERTDFVNSAARIEAANALTLNAGRDVNNTGGVLKSGADTTINAGRDVNITSAEQIVSHEVGTHRDQTITQYGSDVDVGQDLKVNAGRDLTVIASQIDAKRDVSMSAVRDLTLASAADEQHSFSQNKKFTSQEDHVRQVSANVNAGGSITLSAGKDLDLIAGRVSAGDEAYLAAGANLVLQSAEDSDYSFYSKTKKSSSGKKFRLDGTSSVTNVSSMVTSGGNSILVAGQDLLIKGSGVVADKGGAQLVAGNDVQILAVTDSNSERHERSSSKSSWGGLKSSKIKDQVSETRTQAVGSMVSGDTVDVVAGRDVAVKGSSLVSTGDLTVDAARDLTIEAAQNTFQRDELHKAKGRDLTGVLTGNNGGLDDITGNMHQSINSQKHNGNAQETTLTASTVGSSNGNVLLTAGRGLKVVASDLVSTKDMSLRGSDVSIIAGTETAQQTSKDSSNSLAVGRVVGGIVVDTVKSIRNDVHAAQEADDGRLKAVKGAQALLSTYNAVAGLGGGSAQESEGRPANSGGSLIKIGTELGATHSKSSSEYNSETVRQSSLTSGSGLTIVATGDAKGSEGNIHVVGSKLKANETLLQANNAITLESAQNRKQWDNQNSHNKTSIGASFNIGEQNGFTLDLGAQVAKGMGTGSEITQVNSTVDTGLLMLKSGRDTTLAGAQVRAETIKAEIGGNLNIASRQDEASQKSEQKSGGAGASICIPPFCYGATVTATGNIAAGKTNSDYKAVIEQSGLYAGTGGYDIHVGGSTQLRGAVIASEATADNNYLSTDRLVVSDIKNTSSIDSQAVGLSLSYTSGAQPQLGGAVPLLLGESDHSKTRGAVSEGSMTVRNSAGANDLIGLNRDTANANQQLDRPDEKAIQERIDLIQSTVQLAGSAINTYAQAKYNAATEQEEKARTSEEFLAAKLALADAASWNVGGNKRIMADIASGLLAAGLGGVGGATAVGIVANTTASDMFKKIGDYADTRKRNATDSITRAAWAEGGAARILLHALAGAAMGLSSGSVQNGAIGAGASAALMPFIEAALERSGIVGTEQAALTTIIATGLGSAVGSTGGTAGAVTGANAARNVELFNRKLHKEQEIPLLEKKAQELEKERGKPESSALWEDLLLIAAGTQVDAVDQKRLQGILQLANSDDPESAAFIRDLAVAYDVVAKLSAQKIPLTWSDGRQIIANGAPVYAFNATDEQFNDSTLFNAAGTYGPGAVYERWRQYGESQTSQYSGEISNAGTYDSTVADAAGRLSALAGKGVQSVSAIDDAILSLTGLRGGKVVIDAVMEVVASRQAAKRAAAEALVGKGDGVVKPTVELFGGKNSQTPGAINVDIRADIETGIRADATKLPFRNNSLGEIIASNPFIPKSAGGTNSMMDFLPEASRVVEPGGKIFVNANSANPYGKVPSASDLESLGLRVVKDSTLDPRFSSQKFLRTDGSVITNLDSMRTVVLEKIK